MIALIFFFLILFLFLLSIFFTILGHFLNFIDNIFGITARKNKKKEPELLSDIGISTPNCPYCGVELSKFPGRKTKCKNCENYIYVRTRPFDGKRILIKEDEIQTVQDEWEKKNCTYGSSIPVIDATKEMDEIIVYLNNHYMEYWNYEEILNINENDRLPIMQYIWDNWDYHNPEKALIKKYPQYDKDDIEYISQRESKRILTYYHWNEHKKAKKDFCSEYNTLVKIRSSGSWKSRFCDVKDEINVYNAYIYDDVYFTVAPQEFFKDDLKTEYIYFWENGEYLKMTPLEFKKFCKKRNYAYPFR